MYSLGREQVWLATLVNLVLALVIGGAVLVGNYKTWRGASSSRARSSLGSLLLASTVLACVSILNALVAFAGPKEMLNVESIYKDLSRRQVWAPTLDAAILFVILTGVAFACDNLITWRCYTLGKAIRGEPIPRWKTVLVHTYIWILSALNWLGQEIPSQVVIRQYDFHVYHTRVSGFVPGFLWIVGSMLLHIGFSVTFVVTFVRSLGRLTQQINVLDVQKIEDLRVLGIKSIVFASGSLVLYLFAWFIFISHPYNYQLNVTTTPYHLGLLLLTQACFIAKPGSLCGCGERDGSPQMGALAAAAAAGGQRAEGAGAAAAIPEEVKEEQVLSARSLVELGTLAPVTEGDEPPPHPRLPHLPPGATSFTSSGANNMSLAGASTYTYDSFSSMGYVTQDFVDSSSGSSMRSKTKASGSKSGDSSSKSNSSKSGGRLSGGSGSKASGGSKSSGQSSSVGSGHGGGGDPQAEGRAVQNNSRRERGPRQVVRHWRELFVGHRGASAQAAAAPAQEQEQEQEQGEDGQLQQEPQDPEPPHPHTPPQPPQPPPQQPQQQEGAADGMAELHLPPPRPAHAQSPP